MIRRTLLLWLLLLMPLTALGQEEDAATVHTVSECTERIEQEFDKVQNLYRQSLFGLKKAAEAPIGNVRMDTDATEWIKADKNTWYTVETTEDGEQKRQKKTDREMDAAILRDTWEPDTEPFRRGFFELRNVTTSQIIPYLLTSFWTLQKRTDAICVQARVSAGLDEDKEAEQSCPGCMTPQQPVYNECALAVRDLDQMDKARVITYCEEIKDNMMAYERAKLVMLVEYDAAYRSLLQFAGIFDWIVSDIRFTIEGTTRKAVDLIKDLSTIPCFTPSCTK